MENALTVQKAERFVASKQRDGDETNQSYPNNDGKAVTNKRPTDPNLNVVSGREAQKLENQTNVNSPNYKPKADEQYPGQNHVKDNSQASLLSLQPQLHPLSHDPFLFLVRTMIQEQIKQQMVQPFPYPLYHPIQSQAIPSS